MTARNRSLLLALVCALLVVPSAHAIVINATDYAVGTNLTNAFPGVTLEYATLLFGQIDDFSTSPLLVGTHIPEGVFPTPINTLGSYTDGSDTGTDLFAADAQWNAVEAIFTASVETITVVSYADNDDGIPDFIYAYGSNGTYLGGGTYSSVSCLPTVDPPGYCRGEYVGVTFNSTTPIAFVLFTSNDTPAYVTTIDIPGIPEPPSIALSAAGLLAIGFVTLRRRHHRPQKPTRT